MPNGRRSILRLASLLAVAPTVNGAGDSTVVHAVLGPDSDRQRAILGALRGRYPRLSVTEGTGLPSGSQRPAVVVAIGPAAFPAAVTLTAVAPLISLFASRESFIRTTASLPPDRRITSIYAEPSPAQQMRLVAAIFKRTVKVGALLSADSAFMAPVLQQAAAEHKQQLELVSIDPGISLSRNLLRLASAAVILIFPDSAIYTQASLRELLETTYRRRQPVVGFSEALVAAGTLASAYSDIDDTLTQLDTVITSIVNGRIPAPQYPRYWRVAVNDSVARSLDVVIDDDARRLGDRP